MNDDGLGFAHGCLVALAITFVALAGWALVLALRG